MLQKSTEINDINALEILVEDHMKVKKLIKSYEKLIKDKGSHSEKQEIATIICHELTVHAKIEEELLYPRVRKLLAEKILLDEAEVEHTAAKGLIAQIESMDPDEKLYDAKVIVLGEYVIHHITEEEGELFPKVQKTNIDLYKMGQEILKLKQKLMSEKGFHPLKALKTMIKS